MSTDTPLVGIDFGTTNTVVHFVKNGKVEHYSFAQNSDLLPTKVFYKGGERLITGQKGNWIQNGYGVVKNVKRAIGKRFDEEDHDHDEEMFGTAPKKGADGLYWFTLDDGKDYSCVDIASMIFKEILELLRKRVGQELSDAVISVPANFNTTKRSLITQAATSVGWNVLSIINEPSAAAVAASVEKNMNGLILVFDLGGGTLDVTVLEVVGDKYKVRASFGDPNLGGNDFDMALLEMVQEDFRKAFNREMFAGISPKRLQKKKLQLMDSLIEQKEMLNTTTSITVDVSDYADDDERDIVITKDKYIHRCRPLLERCMDVVQKALALVTPIVPRNDIRHVILVGGGSCFPTIDQRLTNEFPSAEIYGEKRMELVAKGCAQCGKMRLRPDFHVFDQLTTTIAILMDPEPYPVFKAGTAFPSSLKMNLETDEPGATSFEMTLVEMRGEKINDYHKLCSIVSSEFSAKETEHKRLEFIFNLSDDGILSVQTYTLPERRLCVNNTDISIALFPVG